MSSRRKLKQHFALYLPESVHAKMVRCAAIALDIADIDDVPIILSDRGLGGEYKSSLSKKISKMMIKLMQEGEHPSLENDEIKNVFRPIMSEITSGLGFELNELIEIYFTEVPGYYIVEYHDSVTEMIEENSDD